jgi:putative Mn2+ efflux pump MntP
MLETVLIAIGLGMDTFAVGVGSGTVFRPPLKRSVFRLSFHFGLFQALLFLAGYFAGSQIMELIRQWDHFVALGLLAFVGLRMIWEGLFRKEDGRRADPSKGWRLVILSVATSIDALAVGLSFGVLGRDVLFPAMIIGAVSGAMTVTGIFLGRSMQTTLGRYAEVAGGVILVGIGMKIFLEHTVPHPQDLATAWQLEGVTEAEHGIDPREVDPGAVGLVLLVGQVLQDQRGLQPVPYPQSA